jgi:hypothetical protein
MAAHCHIELTEDERLVVNAERDGHPAAHVRRKMLFVWSCQCGADWVTAAKVAGVSKATASATSPRTGTAGWTACAGGR